MINPLYTPDEILRLIKGQISTNELDRNRKVANLKVKTAKQKGQTPSVVRPELNPQVVVPSSMLPIKTTIDLGSSWMTPGAYAPNGTLNGVPLAGSTKARVVPNRSQRDVDVAARENFKAMLKDGGHDDRSVTAYVGPKDRPWTAAETMSGLTNSLQRSGAITSQLAHLLNMAKPGAGTLERLGNLVGLLVEDSSGNNTARTVNHIAKVAFPYGLGAMYGPKGLLNPDRQQTLRKNPAGAELLSTIQNLDPTQIPALAQQVTSAGGVHRTATELGVLIKGAAEGDPFAMASLRGIVNAAVLGAFIHEGIPILGELKGLGQTRRPPAPKVLESVDEALTKSPASRIEPREPPPNRVAAAESSRGSQSGASIAFGPDVDMTYYEELYNQYRRQSPDGSFDFIHPTGVEFKNGYAVFGPHALHDIEIPLTNSRYFDIKNANREVGLKKTPADHTWHHVENGRLQLVPTALHDAIGHVGGYHVNKRLKQ